MNLLRATVADGYVEAGSLRLPWSGSATGEVALGFRPEDVQIVAGAPSFELLVDVVEPLGNLVVVHGSTEGTPVESGAEEEEELPMVVSGARTPVTTVFAPELEPAPGASLRVGVAPERVPLFDLRTGAAIRS